jgi:hypothetical protein
VHAPRPNLEMANGLLILKDYVEIMKCSDAIILPSKFMKLVRSSKQKNRFRSKLHSIGFLYEFLISYI